MKFNIFFYLTLIFIVIHLFVYQIKSFNLKDTKKCLKIFKSNNILGLMILTSIFLGKI